MPAPTTPALVPRPRLTANLRTALDRRAVTALIAAAGYGKTSAALLALSGESGQASA